MIETGRHRNIPKEQRNCPFCEDQVENEVHFLFKCPTFLNQRNDLSSYVQEHNLNFLALNDNEKLKYLMDNMDTYVAKYIYNTFELRSFLVSCPRTLS